MWHKMRLKQSILCFAVLLGLPIAGWACLEHGHDELKGEYHYVSTRNASMVASVMRALVEGVPERFYISNKMGWYKGGGCPYEGWGSKKTEQPPIDINDPMLADVRFSEHSGDSPIPSQGYEVYCDEEQLGVILLHGNIAVIPSDNGSAYYIFEKYSVTSDGLNKYKLLESAAKNLARLEFLEAGNDEESDIRKAVSEYLHTKGVTYKFGNPVISRSIVEALENES